MGFTFVNEKKILKKSRWTTLYFLNFQHQQSHFTPYKLNITVQSHWAGSFIYSQLLKTLRCYKKATDMDKAIHQTSKLWQSCSNLQELVKTAHQLLGFINSSFQLLIERTGQSVRDFKAKWLHKRLMKKESSFFILRYQIILPIQYNNSFLVYTPKKSKI